MAIVKELAMGVIDELPDRATWDDILYALYVRQKIEAGFHSVREGRTLPHAEVKRRILSNERGADWH